MHVEVRDLWPESAVPLGVLTRAGAIRASTWLEEACYRRARRIVCVTRGIADRLLERHVPPERVVFIPNGANTEISARGDPVPALRASLGLGEGGFVVIYTGNLGLLHGVETVLEAAERLAAEPGIRFLLVGDGPRKAALKAMAAERSLHHVMFHDAVPEPELPGYIALADLGLHVQRRPEIARMALPVKRFGYMACGKPVLLAAEGETADLVASSRSGVVVAPEDPAALSEAVLALRKNPALRDELGRNGRQLVEQRFSRQAQAARLARLLEQSVR